MDEQESIAHEKARPLAKGYVQNDGVDCEETFAPVIPSEVLLLIVGKFTSLGWNVRQADIFTALLNGDVDSELHVRWDNKFYKLRNGLYSLKRSPPF